MPAKLVSTVVAILLAAGCAGEQASPSAVPSPRVSSSPSVSSSSTPTASPTILAPTPAPVGLAWKGCGGGLQCAVLDVPLDYANPSGKPIRLALVRRRATDRAHRIGSIVVNPGGPGLSGDAFVRNNPKIFGTAVMARFDIVGFDPRGVGSSSPVRCLNKRPVVAPAAPDTAAEKAVVVDSATAVTAACEANAGDVLPYLGTGNVARDLEQIRIAIGDDKLTYVGWSYGTLIGALYASMYPTHIRAMVLDGVVDPDLDLREFDLDQAVAFQHQFNKFFAYCAGRSWCAFYSHGKPRAAFDALMAKIDADPRILSERDAVYGIMTYLSDDNLTGLAAALAAAAKGNGSRLRDAGAMSASFLDGFDAVFCADYAASRDPEAYAAMAAELAKAAPDFGAPNAYFNFDCVYWPFQSQRVPARVSAPGAPPILIISATGDPNTPHAWGESLAAQLSSSVLLTRDGDGHTSMFRSACVRTTAETYILKLATPPEGTTCK